MAIFHGNSIPAGGSGSYYDYEITNSLRFNKDNNPYLTHPDSFSPNSPYTVSFWVKRGKLSSNNYVYRINSADNFYFGTSDNIHVERRTGSLITTRVFRDISSWYHIVVKSTSSDYKLYVNGVLEQTTTSGANPYSAGTFNIGNGSSPNTSSAFDGYMAEWHWVDGQALGPENFGETGTYGDWKPKEYTGSHGSTGFHLDFKDSSSVSSLGNDVSGNGNHFTVNNIATGEQYPDSPTNNFAVMNNLDSGSFATTFAGGNINMTTGGSGQEPGNMATMGMTSGKWYFEVCQTGGNGINALLGIRGTQAGINGAGDNPGRAVDGYGFYGYNAAQNIVNNGQYLAYGSVVSYGNGDLISMAVDLDNSKMYWAKNGVYINSANPSTNSNGLSIVPVEQTNLGAYFPCFGDYGADTMVFNCNFGQNRGFDGNISPGGNSDDNGIGNFKYAPPAGFLSLCSANLPEPTVMPSEHFNTVLYTGTGGARSITGVGFQPDLHWLKIRAGESKSHMITDAVRGAGKYWQSDSGGAENNDIGTVASFDADGWSFGGSTPNQFNYSGRTYVAWNWKAGTSVSGNTSGSGTAKAYTTSYNADAGFSITKYEGNGTAGHTIPHHLGAEPDMIIVKNRVGGDSAYVYSSVVGNTQGLQLSNAGAANTTSAYWNNTSPTSSVWTVASNSGNNSNGSDYIAYCFRNIEGYSKVGLYKGNSNSDGAFVYCGFRPQFLLIKPTNYGDGWKMWDTVRGAQNGRYNQYPPGDLKPNQTHTENFSTAFNFDFVSNGFKWRGTDGSVNGGYDYLYYAIAEQPFKHTNAR